MRRGAWLMEHLLFDRTSVIRHLRLSYASLLGRRSFLPDSGVHGQYKKSLVRDNLTTGYRSRQSEPAQAHADVIYCIPWGKLGSSKVSLESADVSLREGGFVSRRFPLAGHRCWNIVSHFLDCWRAAPSAVADLS